MRSIFRFLVSTSFLILSSASVFAAADFYGVKMMSEYYAKDLIVDETQAAPRFSVQKPGMDDRIYAYATISGRRLKIDVFNRSDETIQSDYDYAEYTVVTHDGERISLSPQPMTWASNNTIPPNKSVSFAPSFQGRALKKDEIRAIICSFELGEQKIILLPLTKKYGDQKTEPKKKALPASAPVKVEPLKKIEAAPAKVPETIKVTAKKPEEKRSSFFGNLFASKKSVKPVAPAPAAISVEKKVVTKPNFSAKKTVATVRKEEAPAPVVPAVKRDEPLPVRKADIVVSDDKKAGTAPNFAAKKKVAPKPPAPAKAEANKQAPPIKKTEEKKLPEKKVVAQANFASKRTVAAEAKKESPVPVPAPVVPAVKRDEPPTVRKPEAVISPIPAPEPQKIEAKKSVETKKPDPIAPQPKKEKTLPASKPKKIAALKPVKKPEISPENEKKLLDQYEASGRSRKYWLIEEVTADGFIVINLGAGDGLKPGASIQIAREGAFLAQGTIRQLSQGYATASVSNEAAIKAGDDVLFFDATA